VWLAPSVRVEVSLVSRVVSLYRRPPLSQHHRNRQHAPPALDRDLPLTWSEVEILRIWSLRG